MLEGQKIFAFTNVPAPKTLILFDLEIRLYARSLIEMCTKKKRPLVQEVTLEVSIEEGN